MALGAPARPPNEAAPASGWLSVINTAGAGESACTCCRALATQSGAPTALRPPVLPGWRARSGERFRRLRMIHEAPASAQTGKLLIPTAPANLARLWAANPAAARA